MGSCSSHEEFATGAAPAAAFAEEAAAAVAREYHHDLSTPALIAEVRLLLFTERRAGRLVCRYLADLADRVQERREGELLGYVDELHAAACFFELGARETRERVRVGRALRSLPRIEAAFIAGGLCYSRVREVTRVACAETEQSWLELARKLDMRALERRVAGSTASAHSTPEQPSAEGRDQTPQPATTGGRSPARARTERRGRDAMRVTFELSVEAWALVEHALESIRQRGAAPLSDAEALEAIARAVLADASSKAAVDEAAPSTASALNASRHVETSGDATLGETAPQVGSSREHDGLPRVLGLRDRWTLDELAHESGLTVPKLQHALLVLELEGRIRRASGWIEVPRRSRGRTSATPRARTGSSAAFAGVG